MHPDQLSTHHIVRRIDSTRIRLLSAVMPTMQYGAILEDLGRQHNLYRLYWPLADPHSFAPRAPTADELRASPGIRPTIAGRPASAAQIAEELSRSSTGHPEPVSELVPEQARAFRVESDSPDQVPPAWTGSDGSGQEADASEPALEGRAEEGLATRVRDDGRDE